MSAATASSSFGRVAALLLLVVSAMLVAPGGAADRHRLRVRPAVPCGPRDVFVSQDVGEPQPNGASEYRVEVANRCGGGDFDGDGACVVVDVHLFCGNFRSVVPIDPEVLRPVAPGDCLLANGGPILVQTGNVSFVYASYVRYEMSVLNATCIH